MTKPHIAIVTHALGSPVRGNGTTVARWMGALGHRGYTVEAVRPGHEPKQSPDLVHGYHALHGGVWGRTLAQRRSIPLIVSLAGTDVHACTKKLADAEIIQDVLSASAVVTAAFKSFQGVVANTNIPFRTVRRGVYLEADRPVAPRPGPLRVMLVAGLRPVKDPLFALLLLSRLRSRGLSLALRIVGPTLDADYAERVHERAIQMEDVSLATLPREAMGGAYGNADVVWNTSVHEGGSNAALEALSYGCAVALRNVPGNRELAASADSPLLLFDDEVLEQLIAMHRQVAHENDEARHARWQAARAWLAREHNPEDEADELEAAYRVALKSHG